MRQQKVSIVWVKEERFKFTPSPKDILANLNRQYYTLEDRSGF
jgi:hypothetical protein